MSAARAAGDGARPVLPVADPPPSSPAPASTLAPLATLVSLVDADLLAAVPADVPELLALLARADLYVQDEVDARTQPTLTRLWSRKGRAGQRRVHAPGTSARFVAAGAIDWRDGWTSVGFGLGRTAALFCGQLDHLVARSRARGRVALVLCDNARVHTPVGSRLVRQALERHGDALRLVYTPAYDPEANPIERLWPAFRRAVTHNHHRDDVADLYRDAEVFFALLDADPDRALRHIGSPFTRSPFAEQQVA